VFPPQYVTLSLQNSGITHPVLIDIVSGEINSLQWKPGTTDTLEALPIRDSVMAITDGNYFDWPILSEAPSSLDVSISGTTANLTWQVHGGNLTGVVVEPRIEEAGAAMGVWNRIAKLPSPAMSYGDSNLKKGQPLAYRVRAINDDGESAYSNVVHGKTLSEQ